MNILTKVKEYLNHGNMSCNIYCKWTNVELMLTREPEGPKGRVAHSVTRFHFTESMQVSHFQQILKTYTLHCAQTFKNTCDRYCSMDGRGRVYFHTTNKHGCIQGYLLLNISLHKDDIWKVPCGMTCNNWLWHDA